MGRIVVGVGIAIAAIGLLLWGIEALTGRSARTLPGDIHLRRGPVTFYLPIVTMILLSIILTLVLNIVFRRR